MSWVVLGSPPQDRGWSWVKSVSPLPPIFPGKQLRFVFFLEQLYKRDALLVVSDLATVARIIFPMAFDYVFIINIFWSIEIDIYGYFVIYGYLVWFYAILDDIKQVTHIKLFQ